MHTYTPDYTITSENDIFIVVDVSIPSPSKDEGWVAGRNHEIPGQATVGQLQAAPLSVRVIYQSVNTVPCCVHLVFPLARSTKQCYDATVKVNSSATEYEQTPNYLQHQMIFKRFPLSKDCLLYTSPSPRDRQKSRMPSSA